MISDVGALKRSLAALDRVKALIEDDEDDGVILHAVSDALSAVKSALAEIGTVPASEPVSDTVAHPSHYGGDTTYEAIKVIEAWGLNFCLGNVVKYIARHQHKGAPVEDLKKALWLLRHEVERMQNESTRLTEKP